MPVERKRYRAFISYNQTDKKWAQQLHKALETYQVPLGVMADIDPKKRTIGRIFRDDEEMGASQSLGAALEGALEDSEVLIVLCSPNSARSQWVDLEVRRFKRKAGAKVFAVIIDGEPNTGNLKTECFCPALRFAITPDGELTNIPDEPLAPDWRKDGLARIKTRLTAGILDVNFDDLWQRDRRRLKLQRLKIGAATVVGLLALCVAGVLAIRTQNYERSTQLATAAHRAVLDQLSLAPEQDRGSNTERGLRLAVLAAKGSMLRPISSNADAALISAAFHSNNLALLTGHTKTILTASFSPDSSKIASISYDATVRIWNAQTGEEQLLLDGKPTGFNSVAFSPDSKYAVIVDFGTANIVNIETGELVSAIEGTSLCTQSAVFMRDGKRLLTQCVGGLLQIWDIASGREVMKFKGDVNEYIRQLVISPDETRLFIEYSNDTAILWDVVSGKRITQLSQTGAISAASFSADSSRLITGGADSMARLYLAASGKILLTFDVDESDKETQTISWVSFSTDDRYILTTGYDGITRSWDAATGKIRFRFGEKYSSNKAIYNPGSSNILTVGRDDIARLWDATTGQQLARYQGHDNEITHAEFAPDGNSFLTVSRDNTIRVWRTDDLSLGKAIGPHVDGVSAAGFNADNTKIITADAVAGRVFDVNSGVQLFDMFGHKGLVTSAAFGIQDHRVVTTAWDGTARLWDTTARSVITLDMNNQAGTQGLVRAAQVNAASFNPQGDRLLTHGDGGTTRLWDTASGQQLAHFNKDDSFITSIAFSADGTFLASSSSRGTYLWDGQTGDKKLELKNNDPAIFRNVFTRLAIRPDASQVATISDDNYVLFWHSDTGALLSSIDLGGDSVKQIIYSPDGTRIIVGDDAGVIRVFEVSSGIQRMALLGHPGAITRLASNATGDRLISASLKEANLRIWDIETGFEIARLSGLNDTISSAIFSPNNNYVLGAGYYDNTARLWDVSTLASSAEDKQNGGGALLKQVCDPINGKLKGRLRNLTVGDVAAVPFLTGRLGEDVCIR